MSWDFNRPEGVYGRNWTNGRCRDGFLILATDEMWQVWIHRILWEPTTNMNLGFFIHFVPIFLGILGDKTFIFPWFLGSKGIWDMIDHSYPPTARPNIGWSGRMPFRNHITGSRNTWGKPMEAASNLGT